MAPHDAGVVDQHIHLAEFGNDAPGKALDIVLVADVRLHEQGPGALFFNAPGAIAACDSIHVDHNDPRTRHSEQFHGGGADAGASASDNDHLAIPGHEPVSLC